MEAKKRIGVILVKNGKILLIHRWNEGREYFVVPGGGVEEGETPQEAALREIKEETNLTAANMESFLEFSLKDDGFGKPQYNIFYVCRSFSGNEEFGVGGPERELESAANRYLLEWVGAEALPGLNLLPTEIKEKLLRQKDEIFGAAD
jgi:8-oxo-dGTP diphosphatase